MYLVYIKIESYVVYSIAKNNNISNIEVNKIFVKKNIKIKRRKSFKNLNDKN